MILRHEKEIPDFIANLSKYGMDVNSQSVPPQARVHVKYLLSDLTKALRKRYNKRVVVLIDEYDTPLNYAADKAFFDKVSKFLGGFYSASLKGNCALSKACLVGIVDIFGARNFSVLNNVTTYSVPNETFSNQFGFTQEEIRNFLGGDEEKVKKYMEWFNGYRFGSHSLINPYSLMSSVRENTLEMAWANSASTGALADEIKYIVHTSLPRIIPLLKQGGEILCSALDPAVHHAPRTWHLDSALHYLVLTGYLAFYRRESQENDFYYSREGMVRIPNREVRNVWIKELEIVLTDQSMFRPGSQEKLREILRSQSVLSREEFRLSFCQAPS
jgi:hypothetical protein